MAADFYKYHALGNDYLVIEPGAAGAELNEAGIRLICDRHFGLGSDGILYGPIREGDRLRVRILNPDGSEAEKSGNGVRIFAKYLWDRGYVGPKSFCLETLGGRVGVEILDERANLIKVDMGAVTFQSGLIPVAGEPREVVDEPLAVGGEELRVTCVSIGNPHCVIPEAKISPERACALGPLIERHPIFPKRINVQFLQVLDRSNIRIEIWERGAGYTLASGSSSCAAASAAHRLGLVESALRVHMPGGAIDIGIEPDGHVFMTGGVTGVARGEFAEDLKRQLAGL